MSTPERATPAAGSPRPRLAAPPARPVEASAASATSGEPAGAPWLDALCKVLLDPSEVSAPTLAQALSRALRPAAPHDRLFLLTVAHGAREASLRAGDADAALPAVAATLPLPARDDLASYLELPEVRSSDTSAGALPFEKTLARAGFASFVAARVPCDARHVRAWLALAWREPGRAASAPSAVLAGAAHVLALHVEREHHRAAAAREHERHARELSARAEGLAFLRELSETVAGELSAEGALHRAIAVMTARLPLQGVAIARSEGDAGSLSLVAARGLPPELLMRFLALGLTLSEDRLASVPASLVGRAGAPLFLPLRHASRLVGVALVLPRGTLEPHARELLEAASRTVGVALHAAIEYAEVARLAAERRQLLDTMPSIVFRLDASTGATRYANAAVERVLGTPVERALGAPGLEALLLDDAEREAWAAARAQAASGAVTAWEDRRFRHAEGRVAVLRTRLRRVEDARGRAELEGIAQDVTDEFEARRQLVQADRLASLGTLAAGVAHEINNPTAFMLLGVQQLGRLFASLEGLAAGDAGATATLRRVGEVLDDLTDGVQRITQIVGELKLFARIPESAFSTPVDVNRLLVSAVTLAQAELRHRARVEVDLGELPPLPGDHARLGQVFVNLLINAAQAIPPGDEERNAVVVRTRAHDGYVTVDVSDTGVGIAPEHLPRIFDPFFTTKAPGEGTGLGLAISYDLVRRAGGTIKVESAPGKGTLFRVMLPVREVPPQRGSRPRLAPIAVGGRVLLIEDEHHLGVAIARALAPRYLVELVSDGASALERIEAAAEGAPFAAVLCDLRMPGMDGREVYDRVRARFPAVAARFVFLTGAGLGSEYEPFVRSTDRPVLEKPFDMAELEEVVAAVASPASSG